LILRGETGMHRQRMLMETTNPNGTIDKKISLELRFTKTDGAETDWQQDTA